VSRLAEVSRQPPEVAVGIGDERGDQGPVLEMLAEREYELVALEIGEKRFQGGAGTTQEALDGRVVFSRQRRESMK